ncbi:hypothetical protein [Nitrospira sp. Nam80]
MTEFEQIRESLSTQRRDLDTQRREALLAGERVKQLERTMAQLGRRGGPGRSDERARLEEELKRARAQADRAGRALSELSAAERERFKEFTRFTDPRETLRLLPDDYPIVLLPLRLETRFKSGPEGQPQLWVRVYPDTCLLDSFEETLSEQEVANARLFWAAIWRAGGDESLERSAWRELVASHGSGRAGWIVQQYQPMNPNEKPAKDSPTDILLIIPADQPMPAAGMTYWESVWRADGRADLLAGAFTVLEAAVGAAQAREIQEHFRPVNLADVPSPPHTRADVQVKVALLRFPDPGAEATRRSSWSSAPKVSLLPERFILIGTAQEGASRVEIGRPIRTPLVVGPDPNAPPDQQLKPVDDQLQIPDELAWMFDFEKALEVGMAFRFDLTSQQAANGFERLVVLGVRLADSSQQGRQNLETLLLHHLHSRGGLEILPQGTPTNNTEQGGTGYTFRDEADATFDLFFRRTPQYTNEPDPLARRDGQWLADLLGLSPDLVQQLPHADGRDQSEARAMQIALWPGTLGYMMRTLLSPVFSDDEIASTRSFFTRYVSGRGPLPALRIGIQPYGLLLTTSFDRINWFEREGRANYLGKLYGILARIEADWRQLLPRLSYIGKSGGDPHQILLDVLGLHPSSVEYYPLQAESLDHKFYELLFFDSTIAFGLLNLFPSAIPLALLRSFGYVGAEVPDLLTKVFKARQTPLTGPLIDDRPLSEQDPIRNYAGARNYIEWLIDAAQAGIERVQQEQGFDGGKKPAALLYLLLRHALQLTFYETGVRLQTEAGLIENPEASYREPNFVHVREPQNGSESRYSTLFRPAQRITGRDTLLLGDYIARGLRTLHPNLREHIEALERLSRVPTARLERIFAEHVDTVTYRLDAWETGLLTWQLESMRQQKNQPGNEGQPGDDNPGLFLGTYGWLEPVRPKQAALTPVQLPQDLADKVNQRDQAPLMRDSTNEGLIHAPSLNHATTAAVLRNGYLANDGRLAVNLSSRRVRQALAILEGMRNGQSMGALLGYQLERHIHDHGPLQVRDLVYHLRRAFPLAANQIQKTSTDDGDAKDSIAAMNVVDGRKLLEHAEQANNYTYPFGIATLPRRAADQEAAITNAVASIRDANDAVADLVLAEGVHQAVLGNYDRSAGTLDAFAKGNYPPEPDIVRTPRSGIALTLRTAIHLSPEPPANPLPAIPLTPLSKVEPALNAWLTPRFPAPDDVGCEVRFTDRGTGLEQNPFISQTQLGLQPIDLIYRIETQADQAVNQLDDRILDYIHRHHAPRLDRPIVISYTARQGGKITWFELQALLNNLRPLVVGSRPLQPADLIRHNDASRDDQGMSVLSKTLIQAARDDLHTAHLPALDTLISALDNAAVTIDAVLAQFAATVGSLASYRLPQTGIGFVYEWRAGLYSNLTKKISDRVKQWDDRLARYQSRIDEYDALPASTPEADRFKSLQAAEILISTQLTAPPPANAGDYRVALDGRRTAFETKQTGLLQLINVPRAIVADLLADIQAALPLTDFDAEPFDFTDEEAEVGRFRIRLKQTTSLVKEDVAGRIAKADALLVQHDAASSSDKIKLLQQAAKFLFGEDFQLIPRFTLPAAAADEVANAWQHSRSGALTKFLRDPKPSGAGRDFPLDDWLHGVARVRERMKQWETVLLLDEAFPGVQPPELIPLQLPHGADEPWLALDIPSDYKIDSDRLLYTAHFADPFDKTNPLCGLLIDEWTEVIPGTEETTGIAFHFDRPNAEPPQAWLVALPAVRDGAWSWDDLLGAVHHALDAAKLRAVEPAHVDTTAYSWFLPATTSAYTFPEISISNNLLRNLDIFAKFAKE